MAGLASVLPEVSRAATRTVWLPAETVKVEGLLHAANVEPSTEQRNVEPGSVEAKASGTFRDFAMPPAGTEVKPVSGAMVSEVTRETSSTWKNVAPAVGLTYSKRSVCRPPSAKADTSTVWRA